MSAFEDIKPPLLIASEAVLGQPVFNGSAQYEKFLAQTAIGEIQTEREKICAVSARLAVKATGEGQVIPNPQQVAAAEMLAPKEEQVAIRAARRRLAMITNFERYWDRLMDDPNHDGLRPHQIDGLELFYNFLTHRSPIEQAFNKAGYFDWATGSGKTVLISKIAEACGIGLAPSANDPDKLRALVLAPRRRIMNQIIGHVGSGGFAKFSPHLRVDFFNRLRKNRDDVDIEVATYVGLVRNHKIGTLNLGHYDLVFCDEAHTSLGRKSFSILENPLHQNVKVGFTASTTLASGRSVSDLLGREINQITLRHAVEDLGIVNSLEFYTVNTMQQIIVKDTSIYEHGDFGPKDLREFIFDKQINSHIQKLLELFTAQKLRGIVFCVPGEQSKHARDVAENARKIRHAEDDDSERLVRAEAVGNFESDVSARKKLESFDDGEIDVLSTTQLLELGWDSDKVDFIILASPTLSQTKTIQRIGRGTRLKASEKPTIIVQFDYVAGSRILASPLKVLGITKEFNDSTPYELGRYGKRTPSKIQDELCALIDDIHFEIEKTEEIRANTRGYNPNHVSLGELAEEIGVEAETLKRVLWGQEKNVYRGKLDAQTGKFESFCDQEAAKYLRDNFIRPGEKTIEEIAKEFKVTIPYVSRRLQSLQLYSKGRFRIPLVPRGGTRPICFDQTVVDAFALDMQKGGQPPHDGEMTVREFSEECGYSVMTIMRWIQSHPKREAMLTFRRAGKNNTSHRPTLTPELLEQARQRFDIPFFEPGIKSLNQLPGRFLEQGDAFVFSILDNLRITPHWRRRTSSSPRTLCITDRQYALIEHAWEIHKREKRQNREAQKSVVKQQKPVQAPETLAAKTASTTKPVEADVPRPKSEETVPVLKPITRPARIGNPEVVRRPPPPNVPVAQLRYKGIMIPQGNTIDGKPISLLSRLTNIHPQHIIDLIEHHPDWSKAVIVYDAKQGAIIPNSVHQEVYVCAKNGLELVDHNWRTLRFFAAVTGYGEVTAQNILSRLAEKEKTRITLIPGIKITYYSPAAYHLLRQAKSGGRL